MSEQAHSATRYHVVFGALLGALVVSLLLSNVLGGSLLVIVIFAIAGMKAWLVATHFMHLKIEPHWIRVMVLAMLIALGVVFLGFYIDVVTPFGGMK